ncbi:fibronectin type III domain-containing protein [Chryseobacterium daeguense]|uniref:fibronectin type III domain-containing protein n=1 Tax=Chryseobacterium daeguense TaxID=412438 RepID=UPI00041BF0CA|nr:fibronectin type III domain-containing protein [Chryseobacterium daeguense]
MIVPIKHILNETGVSQVFKLIVPAGDYEGEYIIKTPASWNEVDSIVNINEEYFNIEDFIIGNSTKLKFSEFSDPAAFNLIRNVYNEQAGDARIIFKWIAVKNGVEYDLLAENFEINFNKKSEAFEKTMLATEVELIKSEAQNKLYTREDTTIDLFDTKDLDENDIDPVTTFAIGYKKGDQILSNFYTFDISQFYFGVDGGVQSFFYSFVRADDYAFGINSNKYASWRNNDTSAGARTYQGPFIETNISLPNLKAEISNMNILVEKGIAGENFADASLFAVIRVGSNEVRKVFIKQTVSVPIPAGGTYGEIKIDNLIVELGNLNPGENLTFEIRSNVSENLKGFPLSDNTSIELTTNIESPLVKTKGIRLLEALNQIAKNYTSGEVTADSYILGPGGSFYNTSISTGMYLRGLPEVYLSQKMKTSLKDILHEGAAKLMALGYDVLDDKLIVEDIDYFFKDLRCYDLSEAQYLREGFKLEHDTSVSYNNLLFGSKKYSTEVKFDIKNFNTSAELSTPIKTNKNKLDKQTDLIIDSFKIQELIEDKSSATNDNDDDKVLIDMVEVNDVWDQGVFQNCSHSEDGGNLLLNCVSPSFDTTLIEVGNLIEIVDGYNKGTWTVLSITDSKMKLDKTTGIQVGIVDTPIRYKITSLIKNRTNEGFTVYDESIFNPQTATNIRHNPKYHLARWWSLFGSGLRKKLNTESLKVTNYKNNSEAKMEIVSSDMSNELQGQVTVGANEELLRLRDFKPTFFNGEKIEISLNKITFEQFLEIYSNWKFGPDNNRALSRGYLSCNTPYGIYDIYPFGPSAFSHNKAKNTLHIKGKVKGRSIENPILLSVIQVDRNTVTLTWDYVTEYVNPSIKIQYSLDGSNWETIHTVNNLKTATFSNDIFNGIMTGETVYFRIIATNAEFYNKVSNSLWAIWQFNDWAIKEISRTENVNCGYSYLIFEIKGTVNLSLLWQFFTSEDGGEAYVTDLSDNSNIITFTPPYTGDQITSLSLLNETKQYSIMVKNANKTSSGNLLSCTFGNILVIVEANLSIGITDLSNNEMTNILLDATTTKRYRESSTITDPEIP